jgi:hypothetical protein
MATWITHLRMAEALLDALLGLDETAFVLGNLGPDSGMPNDDWTAFDPPKRVTHFEFPGDEDRTRDLDFYRDYLLPLPADDPRYSYRLGYFVHLVADNLWSRWIGRTTKQVHALEFARKGQQLIREIKWDWYDLDHAYVRDHPDSLFWRVVLPAPNPPVELPFLSERGVHFSLDHIRGFYSAPDPNLTLDRPYPYLNAATLARFVADATAAYLHIHHALADGPALDGQPTALFLLPPEMLTPYPAPLGDA